MAVLFVSHSSKDDAAATALEKWLCANGFDRPIRRSSKACRRCQVAGGIAGLRRGLPGRHLPRHQELASVQRMLQRVPRSLVYGQAHHPAVPAAAHAGPRRGGRNSGLPKVCAEDQGVDLNPCLKPDQVLDLEAGPNVASRLKIGLRAAGALSRVGLDPEAFAIDRKLRPTPFPGLASFGDDDADAALFYGRSREIAETLEALRKMRAAAERQPFMILGASGAGKSSLLKAGIIPRLRREAPAMAAAARIPSGRRSAAQFRRSPGAHACRLRQGRGPWRHSRPPVRCLVQGRARRQRTDAGGSHEPRRGARSRGAQATRRSQPRRRPHPRQRRPGRGDGAGGR